MTNTQTLPKLDWPLMRNNISREALDAVKAHIEKEDPILTHNKNVLAFEQAWADWVGVKYCVMVNSGASANLLTMAALRELKGEGEVIVPTLTWVSDISSVIQNGHKPVFVDIDPATLGMDIDEVLSKITENTKAVFLTHILGYNGLNQKLIDELEKRGIPLIEDVCESHGATFKGNRLGSIGWASNFSFYYAHHISTIEGGMICTNDEDFYETCRIYRSHGMVRESKSEAVKQKYKDEYPDLNPDFIFAFPGYNVRSTEINGILGLTQLKDLDGNNELRRRNLKLFLENLDSEKYFTEFDQEGNSNYALTLVLRNPDEALRDKVEAAMREMGVEFRRGLSGGGNQLRQPYLRKRFPELNPEDFPKVDHVHFFGYYLGNYPTLETEKIKQLCSVLNRITA